MFLGKRRVSPGQIIIAGFGGTILLGTLLLMLPWATRDGQGASFLDALFTATSATCVTGLVVHDTYTYWSGFGQAVLLLLIQIGGMGVVTMAIAIFMITGKKIGFHQRLLMQESISAPQVGGIVRLTGFLLRGILLVEGIGALLLALRFCPQYGWGRGIWYSVFHSISAFCNAGFDLMGEQAPFSSLTAYMADPVVNLTIMALIIVGGLGFFVWEDLFRNRLHVHKYRLHTKLVLVTTLLLLLLPFAYYFLFEFGREVWHFGWSSERWWAALFQTITPRTAGFNTVDLTQMGETSLLLMLFLMLVGGSSGSTAGGFKTTTLATMVLCVHSVLRRQSSIRCFGRRFAPDTLRQAATLLFTYSAACLVCAVLICHLDGVALLPALFETASAVGTVGLSLGLTPQLGVCSHLLLIVLMFFGRVGGLTLLYAVADGYAPELSQMPQENITVG